MKLSRYLFPVVCAGSLGLTGCESFLDSKPTESYSDELVWSTKETVDAFVAGNYNNAYRSYAEDFVTWDKHFSNNMVNCRRACPDEARGLMENSYDWGLDNRFDEIRNCNLILQNVAASTVLDETSKRHYIGEAKMMRAMIYYDLARKGGRYIWVDKVLGVKDDFNLPLTKNIVESYQHVLADLREAITELPEEKVAGRLHKETGLALLSEVCLTAAAYTGDDKSLQQNGKSLYQEAVDAVDAIKGATLDPDYEDMFNQKGAYNSPEIILAKYWSKENTTCVETYMQELLPNVLNTNVEASGCGPLFKRGDVFEAWMDHSPSQNLVDDYLVVDGKSGEAVRWDESSQFKENTVPLTREEALALNIHKDEAELSPSTFKAFKVVTSGISISDLMYNNRDKRFDASIIHDGSTLYEETITTYNHGNVSRWTSKRYGADHVPLTNYATRKYVYTDIAPRPVSSVPTDYHFVIFRYGRALLNKAEALLRLNRVAEAVATFNLTRTVHGGLPASQATTLDKAWEDYKIERRVELFFEGDFYFSLLRWGKYGFEANDGKQPGNVIAELCKPAQFIEIKTDRTAAFVGNVQFGNDQRTFDTRSYLFPITKSVIQANKAITDADQNPGWE